MSEHVDNSELPFAQRKAQDMPGHWLLARPGKKVLRPGSRLAIHELAIHERAMEEAVRGQRFRGRNGPFQKMTPQQPRRVLAAVESIAVRELN